MKLSYYLFALAAFVSSCGYNTESYPPKSYEVEYTDGTLKKECTMAGNLKQQLYHCKLYHSNGSLSEEGDFIHDSVPVGWHSYFRANGLLKARREYYALSEKVINLNRVIRFEMNGDTDKQGSNYYEIYFEKDTIEKGGDLAVHFILNAPYFKDSYIQVTLTNDTGADELLPAHKLRSELYNLKAGFTGEHKLRGFIDEISNSLYAQKRTLYFDKEFWVR